MRHLWSIAGFAAAAVLLQGQTALADPVGTLGSPPGWYNGSGIPSDSFTIADGTGDAEGVELGLRARVRNGGAPAPEGNVYTFSTGTDPSGFALWNYDFSIYLGGRTFGAQGVTASLSVTDVGTSTTVSVDPTTHWLDDAYYDGVVHPTNSGHDALTDASGAQNSENLSFADSPLAGFNPWYGDTYIFTLTVTVPGDGAIVMDTITVNTVPEPATLSVLLLGLAGTAAVRRRRNAV